MWYDPAVCRPASTPKDGVTPPLKATAHYVTRHHCFTITAHLVLLSARTRSPVTSPLNALLASPAPYANLYEHDGTTKPILFRPQLLSKAANSSVIQLPKRGFWNAIRHVCERSNLLIFDWKSSRFFRPKCVREEGGCKCGSARSIFLLSIILK